MVALKRTFDDEDTIDTTTPDTAPDGADANSELADAVEWLKRAGVVSSERPTFERFFEEVVEPRVERVVTELSTDVKTPKKRALNDD